MPRKKLTPLDHEKIPHLNGKLIHFSPQTTLNDLRENTVILYQAARIYMSKTIREK